jgi:serine/threonine-protein kinase
MRLIPEFLDRRPVFFAIAFWFFAVIIIAILVNWLLMPVIAGHFVKTLQVPNVVGISAELAESTLQEAGLKVKWAKEGRYSGVVPANNVLIQLPAAGRTVKKNRTVALTLSKGMHEVAVPDLRGSSQRQAEISLQRLGLLLGTKIEGAHSEIPHGVVIRTEPDNGKKVRIGSKVDLIISSGSFRGKTMLPNLKEMSFERVRHVLDSLGFIVGEINSVETVDKLPNTVLDSSPKPGEYLEAGTAIDLTVAE